MSVYKGQHYLLLDDAPAQAHSPTSVAAAKSQTKDKKLTQRQQILDLASLVRRQPSQNVFEIGVRVVPIHFRGLDQAHDSGRTLSGPQRSCKQPVRTTDCDRTDLILNPIVIDR